MSAPKRPSWFPADLSVWGIGKQVITSDESGWILDNFNVCNRKMKPRAVDELLRTAQRGDWELTHQGIAFAGPTTRCPNCKKTHPFGFLVDGQHRLEACRLSGVPLPMVVTFGLDAKAAIVVDIGAKRTAGDFMRLQGERDSYEVAAACRALIRLRRQASEKTPTGWLPEGCDAASSAHLLELLDYERAAIRAGLEATKKVRTKWIGRGSAIALWVEFARVSSSSHATEFWDGVASGVGLEAEDPRLALRIRFEKDADGKGSRLERSSLIERLVIRTWNRWITGQRAISRNGVQIVTLNRDDRDASRLYPAIEGGAP